MSNRTLFVVLGVLLSFGSLAETHATIDPTLKSQVDLLNELTERRRVNTFFVNEQSIFHGVQKGFVNVGAGNLTFVRRDLVTVGRVPVVLARVYDSRYRGPSDFSPGWRLSLAETINERPNGRLIYTDDSLTQTHFVPRGSGYALTPAQPSDIRAIERVNAGTLRARYRSQWQKTFQRHGAGFRLKTVADNNGNTLTLDYRQGRLAAIHGQNGRLVVIKRHQNGQIAEVTDDQGRTVSYHYNHRGQLSQVTDLGGNAWTYRYTEDGQLHKVKDPKGHEALNVTYDDDRATRTRLRGAKYRYTYDDETTTVKDEAGNKNTFTQNEDGITVKVKNAEGFVSHIRLDENNQVTQLKHNGQKRGTFTYDDFGNPSRMVRYGQDGDVELTYLFDWDDRVVEITSSDDTQLTLAYDAKGNLLESRQTGKTRTYGYSPQGDVTRVSDNNNITQLSYDANGLLREVSQGSLTSSLSYTSTGKLASVIFPDNSRHDYQYGDLGFRTRTQRSNGSFLKYQYDAAGNLTEISGRDAKGNTVGQTLSLDRENKVRQITFADQSVMSVKYDPSGNPLQLSHADSVVDYEYDRLDRLTRMYDDGISGSYAYQNWESDIRHQLDTRTKGTNVGAGRVSNTLNSLLSAIYTRPYSADWLVADWDERVEQIALSSELGIISPNSLLESGTQRRRLADLLGIDGLVQTNFDKPSNSFFLPPEYFSINCEFGSCHVGSALITGNGSSGPLYIPEDDAVLFWAQAINTTCSEKIYTFIVNGITEQSSTSGTYARTFNQPGVYNVTAIIECACDGIPRGSSMTVLVMPPVKIQYTTFIPLDHVVTPPEARITGDEFFKADGFSTWTPSRTFRARQEITVVPKDGVVVAHQALPGLGIEYDDDIAGTLSSTKSCYRKNCSNCDYSGGGYFVNLGYCLASNAPGVRSQQAADMNTVTASITSLSSTKVVVRLEGKPRNPLIDLGPFPLLIGTPSIDWDVSVEIIAKSNGTYSYKVTGTHDGFPTHQINIDGQLARKFDPVVNNKTPRSLWGSGDVNIGTKTGTIGW